MVGTLYNKFSWAFIILVFAFGLGIAFYVIYIKTPAFLSSIESSLIDNEALMQTIGNEQGYQLYYSGETQIEKRFHVTINGACEGAFITINGIYEGEKYSITDTLLVDCKGDTSSGFLNKHQPNTLKRHSL